MNILKNMTRRMKTTWDYEYCRRLTESLVVIFGSLVFLSFFDEKTSIYEASVLGGLFGIILGLLDSMKKNEERIDGKKEKEI